MVPVYRRYELEEGIRINGPAIVEQFDSTLVIYPGHLATVERSGNLMVTASAEERN